MFLTRSIKSASTALKCRPISIHGVLTKPGAVDMPDIPLSLASDGPRDLATSLTCIANCTDGGTGVG